MADFFSRFGQSDPRLPHSLNVRRQSERVEQAQLGVVRSDQELYERARFEKRGEACARTRYVRMRAAELLRQHACSIEQRHTRLAAMYDQERQEYATALELSRPSQESVVAAMQARYDELTAAERAKTETLVREKYDAMWERDCDQLRDAKSKVSQRAVKVAWDVQNAMRERQRAERDANERLWAVQLQEGLREDHKKALEHVTEERARVKRNCEQLLQAMDANRARVAREKANETAEARRIVAIAHEHEEAESLRQERERLARVQASAILNVENEKKKADESIEKREELRKGKEEIEQIIAEQRENEKREAEQRTLLANEQQFYIQLLRQRRLQAEQEAKELDEAIAYHEEINNRRKDEEDARARRQRERLRMECEDFNKGLDEARRQKQQQEKAEKARDLAIALAQLEEAELQREQEEKRERDAAKRIHDDLIEQRKAQLEQQKENEHLEAENDRIAKEKDAQERERIQRRLREIDNGISKVSSVSFESSVKWNKRGVGDIYY